MNGYVGGLKVGDSLICINKPDWAELKVNEIYKVIKAKAPSIWLKDDKGQKLSFIEWKEHNIYIYKFFNKQSNIFDFID